MYYMITKQVKFFKVVLKKKIDLIYQVGDIATMGELF